MLAWRIAMLLCCAASVGGAIYAAWTLLRRLFLSVVFMVVMGWTFGWAPFNGPAPDPNPFSIPDFSDF